MNRTQYTFYESFYKAAKRIKDPTARAEVYDAICEYALYGNEPDIDVFSEMAAIAFELIKPNLDASRKKAESGKLGGTKKHSESTFEANGSKTEAKRKQNEASEKQEQTESKKENKKEKEGENKIEIEIENKKKSYDADGFATFWAAYPKKAGKAAALKAWNKLAPDVVLQEQMGKALEVQKQSQQWRKDGGQYIPMPATWLNGRRWEDEAPQAQSQESQFDRMMAWAKEFDEKHGSV